MSHRTVSAAPTSAFAFNCDGFWLTFYDPWPDTWAPGWWETDDVYVDWIDDGYYLINPRYPGVRVALSVTF